MLKVVNLFKDYADNENTTRALNDVSCEIKNGEFVSIMGPSGSGKSTLLHILSLFDRPTAGQFLYHDRDVAELTDEELAKIRNKKMGFIFQAFNLLARATVFENVSLPLLYSDIPVGQRAELVIKAIKSVDLEDKIYIEASKLSGGQKQRVAIARALINDPEIIFADEPTGNLDSQSGGAIMEILAKLHRSGRTIVLVTHETYTAEFAERLIKLKDGKIFSDDQVQKRTAEFFK